MKRLKIKNNNFYYDAGLIAGELMSKSTIEFRKRYVSDFKRYVERHGGPDTFKDATEAVYKFTERCIKIGRKRRGK